MNFADLNKHSPRSGNPVFTHTLSEWLNLVNRKQSCMAAIHYAAFNGDLKTFKLLVDNGADVYKRNDTGMSALHFAAQGNSPSIIVYLLDYCNFDLD